MKCELFKTLWGHEGSIEEAAALCVESNFQGIEGPVPENPEGLERFIHTLSDHNLDLIAEVSTATDDGMYVPLPHCSVSNHLDSLRAGIESSLPASPRFINTMAGYDAWGFKEVMEFHSAIPGLESEYEISISIETHRGRSLNNPWRTRDVLLEIPELKITCDFSHFCVVAERLILDEEPDILSICANHAFHTQPRVGYAQGPQVTDPRAPEFSDALESHEKWWDTVWKSQNERGFSTCTLTPEFGPDGYLHTLPFTEEPLANLWELNTWIGQRQRDRFEDIFSAE